MESGSRGRHKENREKFGRTGESNLVLWREMAGGLGPQGEQIAK